MTMAERFVEQAKADGHANLLCHALGYVACPIALWVGDLDRAREYVDLLHETSKKIALTHWHLVSRAHRSVLLIKCGDFEAGVPQLRAAFEEFRRAPAGYRMMFLAEMTESLVAEQSAGGLARMEEAIDRAERTAEGWIMPELLRIKGELLVLDGAPDEAAESCFRQALDLSATQGALSWELRAVTSHARLCHGQNRRSEARALLQPVYDRFTEGFDTADVKVAKVLLDTLL